MLVVGIGTEVSKLLHDVHSFFKNRPEIGFVPKVVSIDSHSTDEIGVKRCTFGGEGRKEGERPILFTSLRKALNDGKESILKCVLESSDATSSYLLISNIGGGTGSAVMSTLPRWLKERKRDAEIHAICVLPSPRIPTYRPILYDNVLPGYRSLRAMLTSGTMKSVIYMDRGAFRENYREFDGIFKSVLVDLLLLDRNGGGIFSELEGEYVVGWAKLHFRYRLLSKKLRILSGGEVRDGKIVVRGMTMLAAVTDANKLDGRLFLLMSEDTDKLLKRRGLRIAVHFGREECGWEQERRDWVYNNSVDILAICKVEDGYEGINRVVARSPEYDEWKRMEVEVKYEFDKNVLKNLNSMSAIKVGTLNQSDIYFDVGQDKELKLREDESGCRLIFKELRSGRDLIREEIEIPIEDPVSFRRLFEALGCKVRSVVRKERVEYLVDYDGDEYIVALDSVDGAGKFVEIRRNVREGLQGGAVEKMRELAGRLGLRKEVQKKYLDMVLEG